jgi:hypothetical protein
MIQMTMLVQVMMQTMGDGGVCDIRYGKHQFCENGHVT